MKQCFFGVAVLCIVLLGLPQEARSFISPPTVSRESTTTPATLPVKHSPNDLTPAQIALKTAVAVVFDDTPAMGRVVLCESAYRQFRDDGTPLISPTGDVGVMQINIKANGDQAKSLGLDIYHSAGDNIAMGRIVLKQQGITAWSCYK